MSTHHEAPMKRLIPALLAATLSLSAQETRREVVHASPNPADDARQNSDQVPEVYALDTSVRRIVVLRFKFGTDLLAGLQRMVEEEEIRNAVSLSGFGSVRNYQVHQVGNRDLPPKDVFVENLSAPADVISVSGMV